MNAKRFAVLELTHGDEEREAFVNYIGIDIGSTASKVIVMDEEKSKVLHKLVISSGWNSKETAKHIHDWLTTIVDNTQDSVITATGYGRISVPYADKQVTEITCHGRGARYLFGDDCTVVDIGGQDTKIIHLENGMVSDFVMNDKCSAGTGKFVEVMANRLGLDMEEFFELAKMGKEVQISSMCTVFAESEVISLIGNGVPKQDIANGVIGSIISKVSTQAGKAGSGKRYVLTGGFSSSDYVIEKLSEKLGAPVESHPLGRFAGALGAALIGKKKA